MFEEIEADLHGFRIRDLKGVVDGQAFEIRGNPALANALGDRTALGLELARRIIIEQGCSRRVGEADSDAGVTLSQGGRDAGQSPASPDRAYEAVDLARGLLPNLGTGRFDMRLTIGDIVELIGPDRAVRLSSSELLGHS